jgi:hypothetical protein
MFMRTDTGKSFTPIPMPTQNETGIKMKHTAGNDQERLFLLEEVRVSGVVFVGVFLV